MLSKLKENFYFGIGVGLGFAIINLLSYIVGVSFFIPGLLLLISERKKPVIDKNKQNIIKSYALMSIGSGNLSILLTNAVNDL